MNQLFKSIYHYLSNILIAGHLAYPSLEEVLAKRKRSSGGPSDPGDINNFNYGTDGVEVANTSAQGRALINFPMVF